MRPLPGRLLAVILIIAAVIAGLAIGAAVWPGLPIAPQSQIFLEGIGGVLLLLAFGLAAYCVTQMQPVAAAKVPNHPRSIGIAVAINLVIFLCLILILTVGMTHFKVETTLSLPIMAIAGVVALIGTLALTAISFSIMNLADKQQPLGLPQGSVRAVIALSLVVLFAILTVYLFSSLNSERTHYLTCIDKAADGKIVSSLPQGGGRILFNVPASDGCGPVTNDTSQSGLSGNSAGSGQTSGNSSTKHTAPAPKGGAPGGNGTRSGITAPSNTGAAQNPAPPPSGGGASGNAATANGDFFSISYVDPPADQNAVDFAKQLLVLIGTLVTSVASFYFGSQAVSQAQSVVSGLNLLPSLTGVDQTSVAIGESATIGIQGSNLNGISQAQLVPQDNSIPPIAAKSVTSNSGRVQADFNIPSRNMTEGTSLDVVVSDSAGRTAKLPGAIKVVAAPNGGNSGNPGAKQEPAKIPADTTSTASKDVTDTAAALKREADNLAALRTLPADNPKKPPQAVQDNLAKAQAALQSLPAGASPEAAAATIKTAKDALGAARKQGLPGVLADIISALEIVGPAALPIIGGIPAGPAGIVAGVLLAGQRLYQDRDKFAALKAGLFNAPANAAPTAGSVTSESAMAALAASPIFADLPALAKDPASALTVFEAALQTTPDHNLLPTTTVAAALLGNPGIGATLAGKFSLPQLAVALGQLRTTIASFGSRAELGGTVDTSGVVDKGGTVTLDKLLDAAHQLAAYPGAAAAMQQLGGVTEALAASPGETDLTGRLQDALSLAAELAATLRQGATARQPA